MPVQLQPPSADSPPFPALQAVPFVPAAGFRKPRQRKPSVIAHALSGTIGSVLAEAILFPVDTIKLKVQTATANDPRGFLAMLFGLLGEAGFRGLYRGIGAALIKESIHSLNYWIFHGSLFRLFTEFEDTSATSPMRRLVLNLVSKQLNWLCTVPFEVISSVNQMSASAPGFAATAAALYQEGGLGAFYRGLTVSLILAINPAIMNTLITSMLRLRALLLQYLGADYAEAREHSAAALGAVTAMSKMVATVLTYPLIRAKVLQQTAASVYSGQAFPSVMRQVLVTEGIGGLYRGMLAMSYKTVLWNSLMMAFKHLLGPKRAMTPPEHPLESQFRGGFTKMGFRV
ncbi:PNC1 [Symbiodinium natans]|uniref:PNC1 protein n=1 Tax=Symbiodinium natans TaxID=878477 RepID=A0A812PIF5_9DINO|nr:PNC1 [Symbiodinium natans]